MLSRTSTTLIKLNYLTKLFNIEKPQLLNLSERSVLKFRPGAFHISKTISISKTMSTDFEAELKNPNRHLNFAQLMEKKKKENVTVIDVREVSEIEETGKIPGSINIPLNNLQTALTDMSEEAFLKNYGARKPLKDGEIIFSCLSGGRSVKALKLALELGYKNAENYKGGWLDWASKTEEHS